MPDEVKDIVRTINMLAKRVRTLEANSYSPSISSYTKLVTTPTTLRVFEYGNYWMAEVMIADVELAASTDTTIDTGIDVNTYGTTVRGGYSCHGQLVIDNTNSNQVSVVFTADMRFLAASDREYGEIIGGSGIASITDVKMESDGTNIQLTFTNANAIIYNHGTLHMIMLKQPL